MTDSNADEARAATISIITAVKNQDFQLASRLTNEYSTVHGEILPLFISAISIVESVLLSVAEAMELDADKLWNGICLGLTVRQIEANQQGE